MRKTAEFLLDMLYPKKCPLCHEVLKDRKQLLCGKCAEKLHPFSGALCMKCGKPVKLEEEYCPVCRVNGHYFTAGRSIFPYGEVWRQSLVRFKYYGCREYGDFYAKAMSIYGKKCLERWKPQLIVPVPLHPAKKRMRGFNQSAYLAEKLSIITGIPWDDSLVLKIRNTKSQKKLDAAQRRNNLRKAYEVTRELEGIPVLITDDVYTTGSTMDAMSMCLFEAGAQAVYFLTVCAGRQ